MGLVRLLFAISVILSHTGSQATYAVVGGSVAVQSFYIVSGFYMTLILREKYKTGTSNLLFITNRLLRIYPTYLLVLFLTLAFFFIKTGYLNGNGTLSFIELQKNFFIFSWNNYFLINPIAGSGFIIPQAWTLGLELLFYFVAPFILRRNIFFIATLMLLSFAVRTVTHSYNVSQGSTFTYYFFPAILCYFLLGALSYFIYKFVVRKKIKTSLLLSAFLFVIFFTVIYTLFPWNQKIFFIPLKYYYYSSFTLLLGFIFQLTKSIRFDKLLGELSYPAYITHEFVILLLLALFPNKQISNFFVILITLIFSFLIFQFLEKPIDRYRQNRIARKS